MRPGTPRFNSARLREAREARALTRVALANLAVVSNSSISSYEKGDTTPGPEVLQRLASTLNVPKHFFLSPNEPSDERVIFWRSQSPATKLERLSMEKRHRWLRRTIGFVETYIQFPDINFPDLGIGDDPTKLSDEDIEQSATDARRFWNLGDAPISNVVWLLENNGAVIVRSEFWSDSLDAFSPQWEKNDRPIVILGIDKASAVRSRFDVAHELAHIILHCRVPKNMYNQKNFFKLMEDQAHRFAGAFLLPAESFSKEVFAVTIDTLRSLKSRWRVSMGAMLKRCQQLGFIDDQEAKNLWISMSRRGFRKQEPLDDEIKPEEPRLMARALDMLIDKRAVSREELELRIGIYSSDIERTCGLPTDYLKEVIEPIKFRLHLDSDVG